MQKTSYYFSHDQLDNDAQFTTIDWLAAHHVKRILTHGGSMDEPIEHHFYHLGRLIQYAADRLILLPGGGISARNVTEVAEKLMVHEAHGTKIVSIAD